MNNNIKQYRQKAGLSLGGLIELMPTKKHQSTISNYENGRRTPDIQIIYELVNALKKKGVKCDVRSLFPENKKAA